MASNAAIMVDPDKLFGRHLAVLGNTGSGKSCTVAGLIRWSMAAAEKAIQDAGKTGVPNARFIVLDPNGEYAAAFRDESIPARRYTVEGVGGARALTVPGWLWNGQEWAAFTSAQGGMQRPLLLRALRSLRNSSESAQTIRDQIVRRYQGYIRQLTQYQADIPQSITGFPNNKNFGELLQLRVHSGLERI